MTDEPHQDDLTEGLAPLWDVLSDVLTVLDDIREHLVAIHNNTDKITAP